MSILQTDKNRITGKDRFSPRSTFIELCEYDPDTKTLDVTFKSGSVHRYLEFSPSTYQSFKTSPTHDSYYARGIKGRFASVPLKLKNIGKKVSSPIKRNHREVTLDAGLKRIIGTVNRAHAGLWAGIRKGESLG